MPTTPYAQLRVSVNGGAPTTGGVTVPAAATIDFSFTDTTGWTSYSLSVLVPPGGTVAGWTDEGNGLFSKTGVTTPPAQITLPAISGWGKWMFTLLVNGGLKNGVASDDMTDTATALSMLSANSLEDVSAGESTQFYTRRAWAGGLQTALRVVDTVVSEAVAYTETTDAFTMPAISANVQIPVTFASWAVADQVLFIGNTAGYMQVVTVDDSTHLTVKNLGYTGNAAGGANILTAAGVSPGGIKGADGAAGAPGADGADAGWTTIFSTDFTDVGIGSQNLMTGGDANKTIDGNLHGLAGTADLTSADLTSGTGVVLVMGAGTNKQIQFYTELANVAPDYQYYDPTLTYEFLVEMTVSAMGVASEYVAHFWQEAGVGDRLGVGKTYSAGEKMATRYRDPGAGGTAFANLSATSTTDDVYIIGVNNPTLGFMNTGVYSAGWPTTVRRQRGFRQHANQTEAWIPSGTAMFQNCVYLSGGSSCAGRTITIKRLLFRCRL